MIEALRHGKLPKNLERMEDLLTSAVFGRLRYVPPATGLLRFLSAAELHTGRLSFRDGPVVHSTEYHFWPWLHLDDCMGAEPDVLIDLHCDDGSVYKVLIEAKLWSGKSSYPDPTLPYPSDQLAREWDNLARTCERDKARPIMVYLTADFGYPRDEIDESAREFRTKRADLAEKYPFTCGWLSWRHLSLVFEKQDDMVLRDLVRLAERLDLRFFGGITNIERLNIRWGFEDIGRNFDFSCGTPMQWHWRMGL